MALGLESNVVLLLVAIMAKTWIRVVADLVLLYSLQWVDYGAKQVAYGLLGSIMCDRVKLVIVGFVDCKQSVR